jgi:hypothetical protein
MCLSYTSVDSPAVELHVVNVRARERERKREKGRERKRKKEKERERERALLGIIQYGGSRARHTRLHGT